MHHLPIALFRAAQVRELDRIAIEERGIPGYTLMTRAGEAIFARLRAAWPLARRIAVFCGGGNNGGDGYVVARCAQQAGYPVQVITLTDPEQLLGDAQKAYKDARAAQVPVHDISAAVWTDAEILVDALLGTGLERPVGGAWYATIAAMNTHPAPIVAVDIPSGLHADTGIVMGIAAEAAYTVTFIGLKRGLFTAQGPTYCGDIHFADLGVPTDVAATLQPDCLRYTGEDISALLPPRTRSAHKGLFGHVLVIGGEVGMAGAARMCAEAAARCGAGLISVATRAVHAALQSAVRPELMVHGVEKLDVLEPLLERATVVAVGPGLGRGEWGQQMFRAALASGKPLVVDADALNLLADAPLRREDWVLTPHPGEAGRLLQMTTAQVEADRFATVKNITQHFGGIAVLKGAGSLIATREGPMVALCPMGNPGMASGGMGDVLTGVIASLVAQGLPLFAAAKAGVFLHGRAADYAARAGGERGLMATDLLPFLRQWVNP